jgi:hypothetical protein
VASPDANLVSSDGIKTVGHENRCRGSDPAGVDTHSHRKELGMRRVLEFVAWALGQAWRYGASRVRAAANWARNNWRTVLSWIERGLTFTWILEEILRRLGI